MFAHFVFVFAYSVFVPIIIRADTQVCPYVFDDAIKMVGHTVPVGK